MKGGSVDELLDVTVELPTAADVDALRGRAEGAGAAVEAIDGGIEVRDPWGTAMAVVSA